MTLKTTTLLFFHHELLRTRFPSLSLPLQSLQLRSPQQMRGCSISSVQLTPMQSEIQRPATHACTCMCTCARWDTGVCQSDGVIHSELGSQRCVVASISTGSSAAASTFHLIKHTRALANRPGVLKSNVQSCSHVWPRTADRSCRMLRQESVTRETGQHNETKSMDEESSVSLVTVEINESDVTRVPRSFPTRTEFVGLQCDHDFRSRSGSSAV